ncbi:MAG: carbohydrate binding domain-containing protein, partial [Candidatus Hydrothermarchaeaceae archaeon]
VEILSNSGFENGFEGWRPRAKWSIDSEEAHSGNKSVVLYGTVDPAHDASAYLDTKIYRGILKPNTSYRFSAWIKGNVTDAISGRFRLYSGATITSRAVVFTSDNKYYSNWTYSEGIITTPRNISGNFWIRFYGGGTPAVWIDDVSLTEDIYESSGTLTSTVTTIKNPIVSVTPAWSSTEPEDTDIAVEVSVDNGTTWKEAENGVPISYAFDEANRHLLYKTFFQTDDVHQSPVLHDITLTYEEQSSAQRPAGLVAQAPVERAGINAELVSDVKLSKYGAKSGEVEVTYAVKNTGPLAIESYLTIDDVSLGNKSVKTQLFAAYPRMPYKIEPGETMNFKHTFTVSGSAPAGRYR